MCLILSKKKKFSQPLIATEDIIVYKFVDVRSNNSLRTPFQLLSVEIGNTYESEFSFDDDGDIVKGLHSFKSLKSTIAEAKNNTCDTVICRCVIPKGSRYYKGNFGLTNTRISLASDRLTYVERIKKIN